MIQLVPASKLEAGMYSLFAIRMQGGQPFIIGQLFEVKGWSPAASYCIDLAVTGGIGGGMDASDRAMTRPIIWTRRTMSPAERRALRRTPGQPQTHPPALRVTRRLVLQRAAPSTTGAFTLVGMPRPRWIGKTAISDFQAAATLNQTSADPWLSLGRIYERTGQKEELSNAWDKALSGWDRHHTGVPRAGTQILRERCALLEREFGQVRRQREA
jgi:hypothetical protein